RAHLLRLLPLGVAVAHLVPCLRADDVRDHRAVALRLAALPLVLADPPGCALRVSQELIKRLVCLASRETDLGHWSFLPVMCVGLVRLCPTARFQSSGAGRTSFMRRHAPGGGAAGGQGRSRTGPGAAPPHVPGTRGAAPGHQPPGPLRACAATAASP